MNRYLVASLLLSPVLSWPQPGNHGYRSSKPWLNETVVITKLTADQLMEHRSLSKDFDWRDVNGQNFVTADLNQHQPYYCGSCWVHGSTSALNDRIKIMRGARFPDVVLSRQALMNCVPDPEGAGLPPGCHGGDPMMVHSFMHKHKVPDETCMSYSAMNQECTPLNVCRNCFRAMPPDPKDPFKPGPCWGEPTFIGFGVSDYGKISGEAAMMKEIYARGPIACSFVTTPEFVANYTNNAGVLKNNVYRDATKYNESDVDHIMEVTGWGETTDGTKYWVVRNSWGTYWGVAGWFKLERGTNSLLGESDCHWAIPDFSELDHDLLNQVQGDYYKGVPGGSRLGPDQRYVAVAAVSMFKSAGISDNSLKESVAMAVIGLIVGGLLSSVFMFRHTSRMTQQPLLG